MNIESYYKNRRKKYSRPRIKKPIEDELEFIHNDLGKLWDLYFSIKEKIDSEK